jgi:hypothetical protein
MASQRPMLADQLCVAGPCSVPTPPFLPLTKDSTRLVGRGRLTPTRCHTLTGSPEVTLWEKTGEPRDAAMWSPRSTGRKPGENQ